MSNKRWEPKNFNNWENFEKFCHKLNKEINPKVEGWIFRGQSSDWPLKTGLEKACEEFELLKEAKYIEAQTIREFRRQYTGPDRELVNNDTLYCLALMQHHGAPTRLLDCTYSPYVAAYFALEKKPQCVDENKHSVIYCFNLRWLNTDAQHQSIKGKVKRRSLYDKSRKSDLSFKRLYMSSNPQKLVTSVNAFHFNQRLTIQKGVFLCPGDVSKSFMTNFKGLKEWKKVTLKKREPYKGPPLIKVEFNFTREERIKALDALHHMNVSRTTLFPGLDGFAESLRVRIPYFSKLGHKGI